MERLIQKIKDTILIGIGIVAIGLFILIILPTVPFFLIYGHFSDKKFQENYKLFLERMNGARFFCYNSRKSSVEFAREVIVPELDPSVRVVFVDGKKVDFGADSQYVSKMLYSVKERKGFPYLLKIEDAQVIDTSVNNQFYSIMIGQKPTAPLLDRINAFFSSTPTVSPN
ncbi:hypothetical protein [Hymenobacter sp. IS2118]|uniref:hypothetical protein n=1 Tax=Hymenobacter sp. IS2118 TaxID=1505605 RepID=UPI000556117E|nr:hypothetical protein [Hymenobacter sp. IS2118]